MAKAAKMNLEFVTYYLPADFPILLLPEEHTVITDAPARSLQFHNCLEIGLCHTSTGSIRYRDSEESFQKGDITCIPRNIPHRFCAAAGTTSQWSSIFFDPGVLFKDLLPGPGINPELSLFSYQSIHYRLPGHMYPRLYQLIQSVIQELTVKGSGYQIYVKGLLLALCVELCRIQQKTAGFPPYCFTAAEKSEPSFPENATIISPALNYVEQNYSIPFSMELLASLCHLSLTHFRRVFASIMHMNPLEFVHTTRIIKACNLLSVSDESILSVSEAVGFQNVSSFNRQFQKIMHMSPREYRKHMLSAGGSLKDPRRQILPFYNTDRE